MYPDFSFLSYKATHLMLQLKSFLSPPVGTVSDHLFFSLMSNSTPKSRYSVNSFIQ